MKNDVKSRLQKSLEVDINLTLDYIDLELKVLDIVHFETIVPFYIDQFKERVKRYINHISPPSDSPLRRASYFEAISKELANKCIDYIGPPNFITREIGEECDDYIDFSSFIAEYIGEELASLAVLCYEETQKIE